MSDTVSIDPTNPHVDPIRGGEARPAPTTVIMPEFQPTKSSGADDELFTDEFHKWLENNGVVLEEWQESKGFRAIIDLNKLKGAMLAWADRHTATAVAAARKQAASDIFNLARQYALDDKTMIGSEELRNYHYYNAIYKIGKFHGR